MPPSPTLRDYGAPALDYRMWSDEDLSKWQEIDPQAKDEMIRRVHERRTNPGAGVQFPPSVNPSAPSALPPMPTPLGKTAPAQFGGVSPEESVRRTIEGPAVMPPGGFPPTGLERGADYLKGMPGRAAETYGNIWDSYSSGVGGVLDRATQNIGITPPGNPAPRNRVGEGIDAFLSSIKSIAGQGPSAEAAPVPGRKPPVPPGPGNQAVPPVPPGLPAAGPPMPPAAGPVAAPAGPGPVPPMPGQPGGGQNAFLEALSKNFNSDSGRFGFNLMAASAPRPGSRGLMREPGFLEAVGDAGVATIKGKDVNTQFDKKVTAAKANNEANREVRRERNKIMRQNNLATTAFRERKLIMNASDKALTREIDRSKLSAANKKRAADVRDAYREDLALETDPEEQARLKAERDSLLRELGVEAPEVRARKFGDKTEYYRKAPGSGARPPGWVRIR